MGHTRPGYRVNSPHPAPELFGLTASSVPDCSKPAYVIGDAADYFPYGKVLREYVCSEAERYLTTYHERDRESGLDYRGARYYDADLGRFNSVDPLAEEFAEWSVYSYSFDNPIAFTDPDGRAPERAQCCSGVERDLERNNREFLKGNKTRAEFHETNTAIGRGGLTGTAFLGGGTAIYRGALWALTNPVTASAVATNSAEFAWGMGTDENIPGFADDAGKITRKGVEKLAYWDTVTKEAGEAVVSFFHKGNLQNGKVAANKALSTGDNLETITQLAREGDIHQFDIPVKQYQEWLDNDLIKKKIDLDWDTGAVNSEFRFDASISAELNKYKK